MLMPPVPIAVFTIVYGWLAGAPCPYGTTLLAVSVGFFNDSVLVFGGAFTVFVCLSGMATASGSGAVSFTGSDSANPFDSVARTLGVSVGREGSGIALETSVADIDSPDTDPPQFSPCAPENAPTGTAATTSAPCSINDAATPLSHGS